MRSIRLGLLSLAVPAMLVAGAAQAAGTRSADLAPVMVTNDSVMPVVLSENGGSEYAVRRRGGFWLIGGGALAAIIAAIVIASSNHNDSP